MRTELEKKTMVLAIRKQKARQPEKGEDGAMNHKRCDTLIDIIEGRADQDHVDELENDDQLSTSDAQTCANAFAWLENQDLPVVDEQDLVDAADELKDPEPDEEEETAKAGARGE